MASFVPREGAFPVMRSSVLQFSILRSSIFVLFLGLTGYAAAQDLHPEQESQVPSAVSAQHPTIVMPDYHGTAVLLERGEAALALKILQQHAGEHENDPDYFNYMGVVALRAVDYAAAVLAFERVVLMQPANAGAWLDLAIATYRIGERARAMAYFDYIEKEMQPPPVISNVIAGFRGSMNDVDRQSPWTVQAEALVGRDTNANSGLRVNSLRLTFESERLTLDLDPSVRARSDQFFQAGASGTYRTRTDPGQIELQAGARVRRFADEHDFSTLALQMSGTLSRPSQWGDFTTGAQAEHFTLGGRSVLQSGRVLARFEQSRGTCRTGESAELESRRYTGNALLDGNLMWGQGGIACDSAIGGLPMQFTLIGRLGFDLAVHDRAGGNTRHAEVLGQANFPVAQRAKMRLSLGLAKSIDSSGYSPLLENNAIRHVDRFNAGISFLFPAFRGWEYIGGIERNVSSSNLPLFDQSNTVFTLGIRLGN
jgi:hypothetical protein